VFNSNSHPHIHHHQDFAFTGEYSIIFSTGEKVEVYKFKRDLASFILTGDS
jgi:hypothetical protein